MKGNWALVTGVVVVGVLAVFFQNCGRKFQGSNMNLDQSSLDHSLIDHGVTLVAFKAASQVSDALPLKVNIDYQVKALGDALSPVSADWKVNSGMAGFANCSLSGSDMLVRTLACSSVGLAHVEVSLNFADGPALTKTFEKQVSDSPSTVPSSSLVTFHIPAGTGNRPWNSSATPVVVFKGQTLHIVNDDTQVHRLHTRGSPCPHEPSNISNGQAYDCVVGSAHSAMAADTYDHDVGSSARFYVYAIDGAALYNTKKFTIGGIQKGCVDCHGVLASSTKKNASLDEIKLAISANSGGMGAITLSDDQLKAIVYELSK